MDPVTITGVLASAVAFLNSLIGEGWTRYFLILFSLLINNTVGALAGIYFVEGIISWVVSNAFGIPGFGFPVYYGVSTLTLIFIMAPGFIFVVKAVASNQ